MFLFDRKICRGGRTEINDIIFLKREEERQIGDT